MRIMRAETAAGLSVSDDISLVGVKTRSGLIDAIFCNLPEFVWIKDLQSRFVIVNPALAAASGSKSPDDMVGKTDFDFHDEETASVFFEQEQQIFRTGIGETERESDYFDHQGRKTSLMTTKLPLRDEDGAIVGLIGISHDVTERKRAEDLQRGQAKLLEMIALSEPISIVLKTLIELIESQLDGISGAILLLDPTGKYLHNGSSPNIPAEWTRLIDGTEIGPKVGSCGTAAFLRKPVIVSDILESPLWEDFRALAAPFGFRSCWSTPIISHGGHLMGTFALYSQQPRQPSDDDLRLIDLATHIAGIALERKYSEEQISFMAHHDVLTGLPNRSLLTETIENAVAKAKANNGGVLIAYLDIDNFKIVNDSLGHAIGDELLVTVAARMSAPAQCPVSVFRLGGDEFVFVFQDTNADCEHAWIELLRLHRQINEPIAVSEHVLSVTASVGCSQYPDYGSTSETLLAQADIAMYRAKEIGRDCCQRYTADMESNSKERLFLRDQLRIALEQRQLSLHYQPQLNSETNEVFGMEALVRWKHPERGYISPSIFIEIAEESGMISQIGDWVLREACLQNRRWQDLGFLPMTVSVNVSARQFRDDGYALSVASALSDTGLLPQYLELELTESMIVQDVNGAVATMKDLAALGVQMAIDDFGTGFSSLSALKRFPVSRLKIDQSFVRGLPFDESDVAIASAVISMAQKLGLKVIAEGVETEAQVEFLQSAGCNDIQGYLISQPVSSEHVNDFLSLRQPHKLKAV